MEEVTLFVDKELETSQTEKDLRTETPGEIADLTKRANDLLEMTETRLGISSQALVDILRAAIMVEEKGSLEDVQGILHLHNP